MDKESKSQWIQLKKMGVFWQRLVSGNLISCCDHRRSHCSVVGVMAILLITVTTTVAIVMWVGWPWGISIMP